ncbi:hypothetical protein [Sorangium sp. So ce693]|uniref:hypothetical protein n=1 Tax=Sorangium sp. So ce693 TaxID=3133318 RepID=UPI003F611D4F
MKILVWNIKFFSLNRIKGQPFPDIKTRLDEAARAWASRLYITLTVKAAAADIFVVLEPRASPGTPGTLVDPDSGGPSGLIELLSHLRGLDDNWFLVPPQRINSTRQDPVDKGSQYTECIGVFWRNNRVNFTGPWANTARGIGPATTDVPAVPYDDPWKKVVPDGMSAAGRCLFFKGREELGFPDATSRKPFLTTFTEVGGMTRTLWLFSIHNETHGKSDRATYALGKLPFSPGEKTITLLAGDFNINLSAPDTSQAASLSALQEGFGDQQEGFGDLWPPKMGTILGKGDVYQSTRVLSALEATPAAYHMPESLDFAFLNYTEGAEPDFTPSCQVVDRVAGAPYPPFITDMSVPLASYADMPDNGIDVFQRRWNYGHIGIPTKLKDALTPVADGTSDHLPILLEV